MQKFVPKHASPLVKPMTETFITASKGRRLPVTCQRASVVSKGSLSRDAGCGLSADSKARGWRQHSRGCPGELDVEHSPHDGVEGGAEGGVEGGVKTPAAF